MYPFAYLVAALLAVQAEPGPAAGDPSGEDAASAQEPAAPAPSELAPAPPRPRLRPAPRPPPGTPASATAPAAPASPAPRAPEAERAQVARAALGFLDALVAGDAAALAAAGAERFSFDGEVRAGRDEIRRTWLELLVRRGGGPRPTLLDLEILPAPAAVARLGAPPARIAPLAAGRSTWVGIADVSGRPVVLFLAREGARWAVIGLHG